MDPGLGLRKGGRETGALVGGLKQSSLPGGGGGGGRRTTAEEGESGGRNSQTRGLLGKEQEPKLEKGDGERGGGRRRRLWDQLSGCPQDRHPPPPTPQLPVQGSGQGTAKAWLCPIEDVFPGGTPGRG